MTDNKEEKKTKEADTDSQIKTNNDDDTKIKTAIVAFLQHPSIASLPTSMKISYLENKGLSSHDIQKAMSSYSSSTPTTTQPQYSTNINSTPPYHSPQEYNPNDAIYNNHSMMVPPEPPNAMIPITIGAFLALFGMASYRWLINGDDFILFPTALTPTTTTTTTTTDPTSQNYEEIIQEEDDDPITEVVEEQVEDELCLEIKGLHQTIQNYVRHQQEKERTNRTMDLLVRQKSNNTETKEKDLQMQFMEIKYLFHQLLLQQNQNDDNENDSIDEKAKNTILLQQIKESLQKIQDQIMPPNTTTTKAIDPSTVIAPSVNDSIPSPKPPVKESVVEKEAKSEDEVLVPPSMETVSRALKEFTEYNQDSLDLKKTAAQMLYLYIYNLATHPNTPRYQKIFTNNSTFVNKVQNVPGAVSILTSVGFQLKSKNYMEYPTSILQDAIPLLQDTATSLSFIKNGTTDTDEKQDKQQHPATSTTSTLVETEQQSNNIASEQQDTTK